MLQNGEGAPEAPERVPGPGRPEWLQSGAARHGHEGHHHILLGPDLTAKAIDLARAIGYKHPKTLGSRVRKNPEFKEGSHYFYAMEHHSGGAGSSDNYLPQNATKTMFLTRIGINLALRKTKQPIGVKLRAYFAEVVMRAWQAEAASKALGKEVQNEPPIPVIQSGIDLLARRVSAGLVQRSRTRSPHTSVEDEDESASEMTLFDRYSRI